MTPWSDVWSFGLTLLAMLAGECFWLSGLAANETLASVLAGEETPRHAVPAPIARFLAGCFSRPGFADASEAAIALRRASVALGLVLPDAPEAQLREPCDVDGQLWERPHTLFPRLGLAHVALPIVDEPRTQRAVAIADIVALEAASAFEDAMVWLPLLRTKGLVLEGLGDFQHAVALYDAATDRLVGAGEGAPSRELLRCSTWKAEALRRSDDLAYACELAAWVVGHLQGGSDDLDVARALATYGRCLAALGDRARGAELLQSAAQGLRRATDYADRVLLCQVLAAGADAGLQPDRDYAAEALSVARALRDEFRGLDAYLALAQASCRDARLRHRDDDPRGASTAVDALVAEARGWLDWPPGGSASAALAELPVELLGGTGILDPLIAALTQLTAAHGRTDLRRALVAALLAKGRLESPTRAKAPLDEAGMIVARLLRDDRDANLLLATDVGLTRIARLRGVVGFSASREARDVDALLAELDAAAGASWTSSLRWKLRVGRWFWS